MMPSASGKVLRRVEGRPSASEEEVEVAEAEAAEAAEEEEEEAEEAEEEVGVVERKEDSDEEMR
jgi:hypothetical protein